MARLRHSKVEALSEILLELYSPCSYADFPVRLFALLRRCFSFDFFDYHEIANNRNERNFVYPEHKPKVGVFEAYVHPHCTWTAFARKRTQTPLAIPDLSSLGERQRADLYNRVLPESRQNYQLGFTVSDQLPQLGIALNRSNRDFSEEDRLLFELIKPHVVRAFNTSKLVAYFSGVGEAVDQGYLVADAAWRIRFATSKASRWLQEYFGRNQNDLLPDLLKDWLKQRRSRPLNTNNLSSPLEEFSMLGGSKRLLVRSLSPLKGLEFRLVLREASEQVDAGQLEALGLTKREAEVLFWVSQGKRNSEIGLILGAQPRTITKHIEHILERLSVETRTAAARVAIDHLTRESI
jgi:DNA-binding CsgD family transcriptional regulator